jgi:hypothetical protein
MEITDYTKKVVLHAHRLWGIILMGGSSDWGSSQIVKAIDPVIEARNYSDQRGSSILWLKRISYRSSSERWKNQYLLNIVV